MATNPIGTAPSFIERAKNILMSPKTEWPVIDAEPATIGGIYRNYVIILAAIGPIAGALGLLLMGSGFIRFSMNFIIGQAVIGYLLGLVGVYVLALVIEALAPSFGGRKDRLSAFKLAAYSMTAVWLAGILTIIPLLGILALVGLAYTFYLMWIGVPVLMKSPADKSTVYAIVAIVSCIIIYFVIAAIASRIMWAVMPPVSTVTFSLPG